MNAKLLKDSINSGALDIRFSKLYGYKREFALKSPLPQKRVARHSRDGVVLH